MISIAPRLTAVSLFATVKTSTASFGLRFLYSAANWARQHRGDYDVVHMHSGFAEYFAVSARLRARLGVPTIHSLYCPLPAESGLINRPIIRPLITRSAGRLDALTAISGHTAESVDRFGIRQQVTVVPPALDLSRFHPSVGLQSSKNAFDFDDGEIIVLFVGNAKPQKNLSRTLHAFRMLLDCHKNSRLVVTTELSAASPDARLAQLRREMQQLGVEAAVTQFGIIDNMPELLRACDVLVAPFLDSFGPSDYFMAVLEAMASGKPTIVSAVGGMPEVIDSEVGRLIDPLNHEALGRAMIELAEDRNLRQRLGGNARRVSEHRFSPSKVADSFNNLYSKVSSEP